MTSFDLAGRVALTTTRLARLLRQQDHGELTLTLRAALATIERHGPITLGALAQAEHIAPPTVTKVVNQLEERGLLERLADDSDRRIARVVITDAGRELLEGDRLRRAVWLAGQLDQLGERDRAKLTAAIEVLESLADLRPEVVR